MCFALPLPFYWECTIFAVEKWLIRWSGNWELGNCQGLLPNAWWAGKFDFLIKELEVLVLSYEKRPFETSWSQKAWKHLIFNYPHSEFLENLWDSQEAQVHYYLYTQFSQSSLKIDPLTEVSALHFLMERHSLWQLLIVVTKSLSRDSGIYSKSQSLLGFQRSKVNVNGFSHIFFH